MRSAIVLPFLLIFPTALALNTGPTISGHDDDHVLRKTRANDSYRCIQVNNLFNFYSNTGDGSYNPILGAAGLEFPKGTGNTVVFDDGFVWAGYHRGSLKCGGSTFRQGLEAGPIQTPGTAFSPPIASDPSSSGSRLYSVRRDITPSTDEIDVYQSLWDEYLLVNRYQSGWNAWSLFQHYVQDWIEWPAAQGAPFEDVNHNGTYEPGIDIPGVPGADQTMWHVSNDLDSNRTKFLYGSPSIGIEMQRTIWAYRSSSGLNNTIFTRIVLINKSGFPVDSMFVAKWADPDIGDGGDDFNGCDTTLNLVYAYNGMSVDAEYGTRIPAAGFAFLQTPAVPGAPTDTATVRDGTPRAGWRNLPLYAANSFFKCCFEDGEQPMGTYLGTTSMYNTMRGLKMNGSPWIDPTTSLPTRFVHAGDPVAMTGWVDGIDRLPADRRVFMSVGPFRFAPGDTQEVVIATIAEQGGERVESVRMLEHTVQEVRSLAATRYRIPILTMAPPLKASPLDQQVVLTWDDSATTARIESFDSCGYRFEGYALFAIPDSDYTRRQFITSFDVVDRTGSIREFTYDPTLNATYDREIIPATNSGIRRSILLKDDPFRGKPMVNGRTFSYALVWYVCPSSPASIPHHYESPPAFLRVTPQTPKPGDAVRASYGDELDASRIRIFSPNDASVTVRVIDPLLVTGHEYVLHVLQPPDSLLWDLVDSTTGIVRLAHQRQFNSAGTGVVYDPATQQVGPPFVGSGMLADGLQFTLNYIPSRGLRSVISIQASSIDTYVLHAAKYPGSVDALGASSTDAAIDSVAGAVRDGHVYEIRFVDAAVGSQYYSNGPGLRAGDVTAVDRVPFEVWDAVENKRLIPVIADNDGNHLFSTRKDGVGPSAGPSTLRGRSWETLSVLDPGAAGYYAEPLPSPVTISTDALVLRNLLFINSDTSAAATFPFHTGTTIRFVARNRPMAGVAWTIDTHGLEATYGNRDRARIDVEQVGVYPNPYFATNADETSKYYHFVTFNHLPQRAVIRIFTLSGILVNTLVKDNASQFYRWDLTSSGGFWVSAGIYVVHIEMPDLGRVKILKVALMTSTFIPDHL